MKQPRDSKGRFKKENPLEEMYGFFANIDLVERRSPKIKLELQKLTWKLSKGDFSIYASVGKKGKITIRKPNGLYDFVFEKSDPKTVKAIGELLIKASEL